VRLTLCDTLPVPWAPQLTGLCQMSTADKGVSKAQGAGRMDSMKTASRGKEGKLQIHPGLCLECKKKSLQRSRDSWRYTLSRLWLSSRLNCLGQERIPEGTRGCHVIDTLILVLML